MNDSDMTVQGPRFIAKRRMLETNGHLKDELGRHDTGPSP
jgi:hypothetical protein